MLDTPHTTSVLSVRVTAEERALLAEAAEHSRITLSEFVRRMALESAETTVLTRTVVTIPARDWEAFEAWIARPAETLPALVELARRTPSWER
jgi:uncharacterized protein (DUF1778 family)